MKKYHITGTCHIDLAWHGDEAQYACYLEQFTVLLLDMLDRYPRMTYTIEQAYHYRSLQKRRPDLIQRLKPYIAQGRVEVVGGMISTAETNIPCAESFVRNQLMGMRWFEQELGARVTTGWLVDTFGAHAQVPQVFASFGLHHMLASRFGGDKHRDVFYARGLDETKLLVAGRDCFSLNLPAPERARVFLEFVVSGADMDAQFEKARRAASDGPLLLDVYIEDEIYPTRRMLQRADELIADAAQGGFAAEYSLPRRFFEELRAMGEVFPTENGDLNPEFTGTFSQRIELRLHNRRAEVALLDAEKWLTLLDLPQPQRLRDAWWDMGFVHFHDVFTGSHPDRVFRDVLGRLDGIRAMADGLTAGAFGASDMMRDAQTLRVVNGLPFARREWVRVPRACGAPCTVSGAKGAVPSYIENDSLWFIAEVDACAAAVYVVRPASGAACAHPACGREERAALENERLRLTLDAQDGATLTDKATGRTILDGARDLLVLQDDTGNFQIENIVSGESHAWSGPVSVEQTGEYTACARGAFTQQGRTVAAWQIAFTLRPGDARLGMQVHVNWQAEGKRLRVKLNTSFKNAGDGIYEIPFGVVRRRAYTPGFCRKGEWPAQRFAAIEDGLGGAALLNDGAPGVEILGGTMYTTLLRAPTQEYAGMIPDESSSQHGEHDFRFAVMPYAGRWQDADILRAAQAWNEPLRVYAAEADARALPCRLSVSSPTVLLSAVKRPEDGAPRGAILRLTESAGAEQRCDVHLPWAARAYAANLREERGEALPLENGALALTFQPWQIRTIYVERADAE